MVQFLALYVLLYTFSPCLTLLINTLIRPKKIADDLQLHMSALPDKVFKLSLYAVM